MSEALAVRNTPFFKTWHDEVFKIWETHHLVPCAQGVTLATPSWAEAAVFSETTGLGEGWDALPKLQVPVGFLMAGDATATLGEELTSEMVWRPPVVANERVMDAGHLVSCTPRFTFQYESNDRLSMSSPTQSRTQFSDSCTHSKKIASATSEQSFKQHYLNYA
jgi:hypothetical protein